MTRDQRTTSAATGADLAYAGAIEGTAPHEFSERYQARKRALIAHAAQSGAAGARRQRLTWRAAAAVAAVCIAVPAAAWAYASHADFFDGAFGTGWRESRPAEQGFQDHGGEKPPTPVVYPASDVVQLDPEAAEALMGDAVCDEPVHVNAPDGHKLTITSAVRSEYALAYRFTLHRDGGVTALEWNERTNNVAAKGAYAPHDAQFSWSAAGDEFVYIDPDASTADTLVGYAYSVFGAAVPQGQPVMLTVYTCDVPFNQDFAEDQFHVQELEIPCTQAVASTTLASTDGGTVRISPLGLMLDERGLFPKPAEPDAYDMAQDPFNVRAVTVTMRDGEVYTVFDQNANLDNTLSLCSFDANLSMAFNRLVDPAAVESVEVAVTDAATMDDLVDEDGNWPTGANWPTRTVVFTRA